MHVHISPPTTTSKNDGDDDNQDDWLHGQSNLNAHTHDIFSRMFACTLNLFGTTTRSSQGMQNDSFARHSNSFEQASIERRGVWCRWSENDEVWVKRMNEWS